MSIDVRSEQRPDTGSSDLASREVGKTPAGRSIPYDVIWSGLHYRQDPDRYALSADQPFRRHRLEDEAPGYQGLPSAREMAKIKVPGGFFNNAVPKRRAGRPKGSGEGIPKPWLRKEKKLACVKCGRPFTPQQSQKGYATCPKGSGCRRRKERAA